MYPEGWLMDPKGKSLFYFEKDPMNPIHEGYIELWLVTGIRSKQFRYRKRTSKFKALIQWNNLLKEGWSLTEEIKIAA